MALITTVSQIKHPATLIDPQSVWILKNKNNQYITHIISEASRFTQPKAIPVVNIGFGGSGIGHLEFTTDAKAAYANALAYLVTQNPNFANNLLRILKAWSTTCKTFIGPNAPLEAAWGTAAMARACELLKYTYNSTTPDTNTVINTFIDWVRRLLMPHLRGDTERYRLNWGFYNNWHTSINEARLQFALLCNDLPEVNDCLQRYVTIFNAYVKDSGLTGETYRDSDHCCFGLAGLVQTCELAFHQGVDLYQLRNNLLHKCMETHAGMLACGVFPPCVDKSKLIVYRWIQPCAWEIVYHHFVNRKGMEMPFTKQLLSRIRPCGYELHWGYDTLTHSI